MSHALYRALISSGCLRRALFVGMALGCLGLALAASLPVCPMANLLGIPCPGCGLSRATLALLRGDFEQAYRFHPLVFVLVPVCSLALGSVAISYVFDIRTPTGGPAVRFASGVPAPRTGSRLTRLERAVTYVALACLVAMLGLWLARFMGYFGGPVAVSNLAEWARHRWR